MSLESLTTFRQAIQSQGLLTPRHNLCPVGMELAEPLPCGSLHFALLFVLRPSERLRANVRPSSSHNESEKYVKPNAGSTRIMSWQVCAKNTSTSSVV